MTYHRFALSLFAIISTVLSGCVGAGAFEVDVALQEQRVSGSPLGGLLSGFFDVPVPLNVDLAAETAARDTRPAQHVRLIDLTLSITATEEADGDTDDFDFLDSVDVYVESAQSGSSLPRVRVATLYPAPRGARTVSFETDTSIDLLPYINEGARLTSSARGHAPPDDVSFDGRAALSVEVF